MSRSNLFLAALALPLALSAQNGLVVPSVVIKSAHDAFRPEYRGVACDSPTLATNIGLTQYCAQLNNLLAPTADAGPFATYVLKASLFSSFLASVAESRIDLHNSTPTGSSGSTAAVARAGITDVLGLALEAGAVTQSQNGSALTLQGNALALVHFLSSESVFQYCPDGGVKCFGALPAFFSGLSGSATLNLSSSTTENVTGTVSGGSTATMTTATATIQNSAAHLTSFGARYQLFNALDLRSKLYVDAWKKTLLTKDIADKAKTAEQSASPAFAFLDITKPAYIAWLLSAEAAVRPMVESGASDQDIAEAVAKQWDILIGQFPPDKDKLRQFLQSLDMYLIARDAAIATAKQQTASGMTIEYTYSRPTNQPTLSNAKLAYTLRPGTNSANDFSLSLNIGADFYNTPPAGTHSFRDFQAGLQGDRHFGKNIGTVAIYYQYQHSAAAIQIGTGNLAPNTNIILPGPAATLLAPKGNLVVGQIKYTLTLKSGTQLPIGFTVANRTELINSKEVRGHIGFDFDWSSLLLGSKSSKM